MTDAEENPTEAALAPSAAGGARGAGGDPGSAAAPKKKPGRPKGSKNPGGKRIPGSGRRPGTPNRINAISRDFVIKQGAPLQFLCKVAQGRKMMRADEIGGKKQVAVFPTLDQSIRAAEILSRKVLPDLKATELTGKDGGAVALTLLDFLKELPE